MANILAVAGPNSKYQQPGARPAGFWAGLWHGLISPLTFLISLFSPGVRIYETHNRGRWYDFGFIIGVSGAFGGGGSQASALPPRVSPMTLGGSRNGLIVSTGTRFLPALTSALSSGAVARAQTSLTGRTIRLFTAGDCTPAF